MNWSYVVTTFLLKHHPNKCQRSSLKTLKAARSLTMTIGLKRSVLSGSLLTLVKSRNAMVWNSFCARCSGGQSGSSP